MSWWVLPLIAGIVGFLTMPLTIGMKSHVRIKVSMAAMFLVFGIGLSIEKGSIVPLLIALGAMFFL